MNHEWHQLAMQFEMQGSLYNMHSQHDKAAEMFEVGLVIFRAIGDRMGESLLVGCLGDIYSNLGQYDMAAEKLEVALVIFRANEDRMGESAMLGCLGDVYYNLGQYNKAAEKIESALVIAQEIGNSISERGWLRNLGDIYTNLGQYDKAAENLEAALVIAQENGDRKEEGGCLGNLGDVYSNLGHYDKAAEKLEAALVIAQENGDRKREVGCLGNLGAVYTRLGQYNKAAEKLEAALVIAQENGDKEGEGRCLASLGAVYTSLGQYDKAAEKLEVSLVIARENGDREGEFKCLGNLGNIYINLGQYDKAAENHEAALVIAQEIGDREGEGGCLASLGAVYTGLGQYDKAAEKYEAALVIAREIGDREGEGGYLGNLGAVYINLGQYDKAADKYEAALVIAQEIGDRNQEGLWLGSLGDAYTSLRDYDKAAEKFEAALVIAQEIGNRKEEGTWLGSLGNVYMYHGQYDKVADKYEAALEIAREIGDRRGEGDMLGNQGIFYRNFGQYDKAAEKLEAALEIAREIGNRHGEGGCLGNLGVCHYVQSENQQHHKIALEYLEESIHVYDDLWMDIKEDDQKVTFDDVNGSSSSFAKYLHSLYWNKGHFKEALLTREQASSKSLEFILLENRKDKANVEYSSKQKKSVTNFEQMRHIAIQSKSAIIVYALHADGDILIWVIKSKDVNNTGMSYKKVPIKKKYKSLQYLVESTRRSIGARDRTLSKRREKIREFSSFAMPMVGEDKCIADFNDSYLQAVADELRKSEDEPTDGPNITMKKALRELYDLLILPIQSALVDEQRLTIIPFGDLFALPFAALVDQNGTHLIEKHILSFAPSIGTLVELEHNQAISKDKKRSTVIVGTGTNLSGAREEAEKVHRIITASNHGQEREVKKFIGKEEATKEAVIDAMQSADIIHLATHGSKDGISLSGLTGEDVKLTMGEVQSLNLKGTKMVVLSACDTFKGDLRTDGVVGITRSFLAAGSSTVIASLWPVNDYSTKEMMVRLYKFLFQQKDNDANDYRGEGGDDRVDVSYALQQVMIGMLKEKGGRFDIKQWAPFLVYGLNASLGN